MTSRLRWVALALSSLTIFGPFWAFDNPAATQDRLREHFGVVVVPNENSTAAQNHTSAEFNANFGLLYSAYSLPNFALPLFSGILIASIGARWMNVGLATLCLAGQVIFALATSTKSWVGMWAGRVVFGVGTASLYVAQNTITATYFVGQELSLALACMVALGRIALVANANVSALFRDAVDAYWLGAAVCGLSLVSACGLALLDRFAEAAKTAAPAGGSSAVSVNVTKDVNETDAPPPTSLGSKCLGVLRSLPDLPIASLLLVLFGVFGYGPVSLFTNVATNFLEQYWTQHGDDHSTTRENLTLSLVYLSTACAAPLAGFLIDRVDHRPAFLIGASTLLVGCHAVLASGAVVPMEAIFVAFGVAFGVFAAGFWPAVALFAPEALRGVAYGATTAGQNSILGFMPLAVAALQPPACDSTYRCVNGFLLAFAAVGVGLGLIVAILDRQRRAGHTLPTLTSVCCPRSRGGDEGRGGGGCCGGDPPRGAEQEDAEEPGVGVQVALLARRREQG